jgi:hypothetical protein
MYMIIFFMLTLTWGQSSAHTGTGIRLSAPVNHSQWDKLLRLYVDEAGNVNYQKWIKHQDDLNAYLQTIQDNPPDEETWSDNEKIAYWINAYNAFTIKLILNHYPVKSIKDIGSSIQIPFVNTPWDIKFIAIGGKRYDLNNLEHSILRKEFDEPRIHFAIVCASASCPKLRREAYTAEKLNDQLNDQTRTFLADPDKNRINTKAVVISKIFSWFRGDFTKKQKLLEFLDSYTDVNISPDASISFMDYDWSLNEQ